MAHITTIDFAGRGIEGRQRPYGRTRRVGWAQTGRPLQEGFDTANLQEARALLAALA
jgi:hypothetical protein